MERDTNYASGINDVLKENPTFFKIYRYNINTYPRHHGYREILTALSSGTPIIKGRGLLKCYIATYGGHHYYKLQLSFDSLFKYLSKEATVDIIDYGCGQALASTVFLDYLISNKINLKINSISLIEPSTVALERGELHLSYFLNSLNQVPTINIINKKLDDVNEAELETNEDNIKIHLFSNILDISDIDLNMLHDKIVNSQTGINYFICVSPYNSAVGRVIQFDGLFNGNQKTSLPAPSQVINRRIFDIITEGPAESFSITMLQRIFRCNL